MIAGTSHRSSCVSTTTAVRSSGGNRSSASSGQPTTSSPAVGILIGSREVDEELPWPPGEWLETEAARWIKRSAIVSVRILARPRTTTA